MKRLSWGFQLDVVFYCVIMKFHLHHILDRELRKTLCWVLRGSSVSWSATKTFNCFVMNNLYFLISVWSLSTTFSSVWILCSFSRYWVSISAFSSFSCCLLILALTLRCSLRLSSDPLVPLLFMFCGMISGMLFLQTRSTKSILWRSRDVLTSPIRKRNGVTLFEKFLDSVSVKLRWDLEVFFEIKDLF